MENLDNNYCIGAVLMDLAKTFDCIPHDLVNAKLLMDLQKNTVLHLFILTYLKNRKQCVSENSVKIAFKERILRVPQGSIVGHILFKIFFNNFFYFILVASAHNFADGNTLSSFAKTIGNLICILESDSETAINWFKDHHIIVNPGTFQAIIFVKRKRNHANHIIIIDQKDIEAAWKVKPLRTEKWR